MTEKSGPGTGLRHWMFVAAAVLVGALLYLTLISSTG